MLATRSINCVIMGSFIAAACGLAACGGSVPEDDDTAWLEDPGAADSASVKQVDKGVVHFGTSYEATLAKGEKHVYRFAGKSQGVVRIEVLADQQNQLNTALSLVRPDGKTAAPASWQNADGKNAVADGYVLPADGDYRIVATSYKYQGKGSYSLVLTCLQGSCEGTSPSGLWRPTLRSVSMAQAKELVDIASNVQLVEPNTTQAIGVPWAAVEENCNRRADMVNFALSRGTASSTLPHPVPASLASDMLSKPAFDSATIYLTGPLNYRMRYVLPDASASAWETGLSWDHHVAAVIDVAGTLMVIDPPLSREPIPVDKWLATYLPSGMVCPEIDKAAFGQTSFYYVGRWQFDHPPKPAHLCGYRFSPAFNFAEDVAPTASMLKEELEDAAELLSSQFNGLVGKVNAATQRNFPPSDLPKVMVELQALSEADYCREMNYAFRWCKQFQP